MFDTLKPDMIAWEDDRVKRELKDEVVHLGKYHYIGEWDTESNLPHGYGFWLKTNGRSLIECYCKGSI